jgi:hypothetical protein
MMVQLPSPTGLRKHALQIGREEPLTITLAMALLVSWVDYSGQGQDIRTGCQVF